MPNEHERGHFTNFVVFQAGSTAGDSPPGNVTATVEPERRVEAPSPSPSSSASDTSGLTDDELGIAVGGGLVVVVMFCVLFVDCKRRRRLTKGTTSEPAPRASDASIRRLHTGNSQELYVLDNSSIMSSAISFGSRASCFQGTQEDVRGSWNHPEVLAARVSVSELSLDELVARGTNSEVYRGHYRDRIVAMKKPLPQWLGDRNNLNTFFARVRVLASPSLTHPSIVSFLGVSWRSLVYVCIVSEFMAGGDLRSFLNRRQHQNGLTRDSMSRRGFCRQKVNLAAQVASALSFLHAQGLVHSAVRSRNILLDAQLNAKLTGFQGYSSQAAIDEKRPSLDSSTTLIQPRLLTASVPMVVAGRLQQERRRLDALWNAPEVLRGERSNAKTDIFSFGVILAELDSVTTPYGYTGRFGGQSDSAELLEKVAAGHVRVHFSSSARAKHGRRASSSPMKVDLRVTAAVVRLGKACVALDAFERPSAAQISTELHLLLEMLDTLSKK